MVSPNNLDSTLNLSDTLNSTNNSIDLNATPRTILNKRMCISSILLGLGLSEYMKIFRDSQIELNSFMCITNNDLIKIGINNHAHRSLLLKAINENF